MWDEPDDDDDEAVDARVHSLFDRLFPQGAAGPDVMRALAPEGWASSPLRFFRHPTAEMRFAEALRVHRNWPFGQPKRPEPTLAEFINDHEESPLEPEAELCRLVGECLWGVFSDNHEVVDADGRVVDVGSFRCAGGIIADWLAGQSDETFDYLDFYCATFLSDYASRTPVYRLIFERLRSLGGDWRYSFPRLYLVSFGEPDEKTRSLAKALDAADAEARLAARDRPPPEAVAAYMDVFGRPPEGWPP